MLSKIVSAPPLLIIIILLLIIIWYLAKMNRADRYIKLWKAASGKFFKLNDMELEEVIRLMDRKLKDRPANNSTW